MCFYNESVISISILWFESNQSNSSGTADFFATWIKNIKNISRKIFKETMTGTQNEKNIICQYKTI